MGRINPYELDNVADVDRQKDSLLNYISSQTLGEAQERMEKGKPLLGDKTTPKTAMEGLLEAEMLLETCLQCLQIVKTLRHQCYDAVNRSTSGREFRHEGHTYILRHGSVVRKSTPPELDELWRK